MGFLSWCFPVDDRRTAALWSKRNGVDWPHTFRSGSGKRSAVRISLPFSTDPLCLVLHTVRDYFARTQLTISSTLLDSHQTFWRSSNPVWCPLLLVNLLQETFGWVWSFGQNIFSKVSLCVPHLAHQKGDIDRPRNRLLISHPHTSRGRELIGHV